MSITTQSRRLLHRHEAAKLLGVRPQTLAAWSHYGRHPDLPVVKIGRSIRYRPEDVERFIARHVEYSDGSTEGAR